MPRSNTARTMFSVRSCEYAFIRPCCPMGQLPSNPLLKGNCYFEGHGFYTDNTDPEREVTFIRETRP
jgi:hypothetical protein